MPLRVFEPRYRALMADLMALPDDVSREFGVVAIRRGWEVEGGPAAGGNGLVINENPTLYDVGCVAEVRHVTEHPEGHLEVMTVGRRRFQVVRLEQGSQPYLTASVEWLAEPVGDGDQARRLADRVLAVFQLYLQTISPKIDFDMFDEQLPSDPTVLSHLVAATASLPVDDRQNLLAAPDTVSRLRAELALLRTETALAARVRAVPVPLVDLAMPASPN